MLLQSDFRLNWEDDHEDFSSSLSLSENFKKAFTEIPRLLPSEISLDTVASFDPAFLVTGPSVSFESFNVDAFPVHEEQLYFSIDPDASILEFNETGHLIGASELIVETSTKQGLPPSDSAYYGGDIFVSWEDDIFAGALSIPELSVPNSQKLASPALPESPAFTASLSESIEIVDVAVCTPKKPKSPKQASRKRATPSSTGPSPKHARTPKSALKDQVSPKRQRRHSSKSSVTFDLEPKVLSFHLDREERAYSSPKLKNCKIGPLSSSTHQLSDSVIRNIFKAEQVVTLSKSEDEDDEDVDIL